MSVCAARNRRLPLRRAPCLRVVQALFSNSKALGGYLGDSGDRHTAAIVLALLGFGLTDVSLNILQVRGAAQQPLVRTAARAACVALCRPEQPLQHTRPTSAARAAVASP